MHKYILVFGTLITALAIGWGCDDRGTGIEVVDGSGITSDPWPGAQHVFQPALTLQLRNRQELLQATAYLPNEAFPGTDQRPIPLLVLLAPEGGDEFYYFRAGLGQLMQEMIASGEIQPMVVYCIASDQTFGGYFYGNSDPAGLYDSIFHYDANDGKDDLLQYLHNEFAATIEQPQKRGIGGIGQGAYGAFRAVLKNPGVWGSISVADGPLDFDGPSGNSGLTTLFDEAMAEQIAHYDLDPEIELEVDSSVTPWDSTYNVLPFSYHRDFDSSHTMPVSQMLIGGSLAFSPNDTMMTYVRVVSGQTVTIDTASLVRLQLTDSPPPEGGEWKTLIDRIVKGDTQARNVPDGMDFHLPFDSTGALYAPIWDLWMRNNLDYLYENAPASNPLSGVNIFVASNPGAKWNYYEMTQSWLNYLNSQNVPYEEYDYSGYGDNVIQGDEYLFDILREMLIFHSESFGR